MAAQPPPSSTSSRRSRTGDKVVGSFSIEDEIGKGSFATVYRGRHKASGALVAIKSVNLGKLNKKLKDNLYCEIEILRGLHHPHIVALIDCKESSSHINLVMEYCELGDLSYFIRKRDKLADNPTLRDMVRKYPNPPVGGLNEVIVRHFLKQLASAMEFLRERDYIHRDVKPQNLLLLPSPQFLADNKALPQVMIRSHDPLVPMAGLSSLPMLKLADFGFARTLPRTSLAETLCGSPLYMAPEILRYEKYDARADLWSVGTVLFEMITGRPPFRATNHVELLRKIEQSEDHIKFPKDVAVSPVLKDLIKGLLKRTPDDRLPFDKAYHHKAVDEPIPGLVGDDRPQSIPAASKPAEETSLGRQTSVKRDRREQATSERTIRPTESQSSSPRDRPIPSSSPRIQSLRQAAGTPPRQSTSRPESREQRPVLNPSATAPIAPTQAARPHRSSNADQRAPIQRNISHEDIKEVEDPEQDVQDAREYVLVEKRAVEVNALADHIENMGAPRLIGRRNTSQGTPVSVTGAVPASPSTTAQIAIRAGRQLVPPQRQKSYPGKTFGSPSTTSAITKALNGASLRVFGIGFSPHLIGGKGQSPPQLYSPFPAYPIPRQIGDGRPLGPADEDSKAVASIEESATRSDVVYGFAEVKYKQLIPLSPSMDHGLGGPVGDTSGESEDEGLTVDAVVALSEEALVLYVKALALLATSMDIAGTWWARRSRGEVISGHGMRGESASSINAGNRINSAVQWVRSRFNEVLEKAEFVRLKLLQAQKQLPEDHPGHPKNHASASRLASASAGEVFLSSGITAEKLMYDRAIEMSRSAAINEIANEDLPGCEISYITAIRMLEAVLENDDEPIPQRRRSSSLREEMENKADNNAAVNGINLDDRQAVLKVVSTIRTRLQTVRKKMAIIAKHHPQSTSPRPSSLASGSTTPTTARSPPQ
ncbi:pkinase-domain-containing protein [Coleophoma crateriformis]|uniref:Serine/threonine-protein kinase ATG1 n=1 Tax=Coleophoma crateriformis TaxID=565419 RepID=A0A3D8R2Z2_9HELO|nr:pkinase-domain-containing protein [Coleophoma crateriformis]